MEITQHEHSILHLDNLFFDQFAFNNSGSAQGTTHEKKSPKMNMSVSISSNSDVSFTVVLVLKVEREGEYQISCSLTGVFSVAGGLNDENVFLQDNAIAIMFPYMRSQITLLTSQPGMEPLVIPALNIKNLLHPDD